MSIKVAPATLTGIRSGMHMTRITHSTGVGMYHTLATASRRVGIETIVIDCNGFDYQYYVRCTSGGLQYQQVM